MKLKRRFSLASVAALLLVAFSGAVSTAHAASVKNNGRIFLLMVWDGLRPDLVDAHDTPNLFALGREGVLFANQHAAFPTVTMVNAAVLATGGAPDRTEILGDTMYFMPELGFDVQKASPALASVINSPINLENSSSLAGLSAAGFKGGLIGIEELAHQVLREVGYVAIIGKEGPTFLFDDQAAHRDTHTGNYLFVADDLVRAELPNGDIGPEPRMSLGDLNSIAERDRWFDGLVISRALPAARAAVSAGHSALIVFWQHNPDLVQHIAGLGTQPALNALRESDVNLGNIREAVARLGIAHRTDLMIVSDHGFATIRMSVSVSDLLVSAGIKKSKSSTDIVVARNGGVDLLYLSPTVYQSEEARRATLSRIVDFAEAQEWCGPIFSKEIAPDQSHAGNKTNRLGWIPGTFAQQLLGLYSPRRSPDLIISFRELSDLDNRNLTGPSNPAFVIGSDGQATRRNSSFPLVRPIVGVVYSDSHSLSTGQGMHGAAGIREVHNFCAAAGPDFRRHFVDQAPTGNVDVAPTIRHILDLDSPSGTAGRILQEALNRSQDSRQTLAQHPEVLTSYLVLQGQEVTTTLRLTQIEGRDYLDDSSITHTPLNGSP
jgi:hypothetical protein